nr:PREDICTED: sperm flagellar protein 2-like [Linepithema humile]
MAHVLKAWLCTRLGVMMDLTPNMFAHYTKDGTLLAQILHSYDIISNNQLSTILRTHDPALSRVNLKTLRIWLKLINVTLSDECIEEISKGKGSAALQLFYKVYLSLEGKDRLHFIARQKEQKEKFMHTSSRFQVSRVSDSPPPYQLPEHFLSQPLIEAADTILWHRNKFFTITEACRRERKRLKALADYPVVEPIEHLVPEEPPDERKEESERLDKFDRKHPARETKKKYQIVECCPGKRSLNVSCAEDPVAAAEYVDLLKKRSGRAVKSREPKLKTQTAMMTESWERLLRKQDRYFDEVLGERVLDQSRYEKQIMGKLCEVWDLRNRIVENRRIADAMLLEAKEHEQRLKEERQREIMKEEMQDVEMEVCRMSELRQRICEEKARRMREEHRGICSEVVRDLVDIAVKIAEYGQTKDIPHSWDKWKALFLKNQSICEFVEHVDEIEDVEDAQKNKVTITKKLEMERRSAVADTDFESYRDLAPPWDEFAPERKEEAEEVCRLGRIVLGYVVHRLLEILYPYPTGTVDCPVPRVKVAAVISGITNRILHEQLRELLKSSGICLLRMEDAINHCLERYKREMADVEYIDLNIVPATAEDIKRLETKSKIDDSRDRSHPKKIERTTKIAASQQSAAEEKQTQTPRQIPYDDMHPILSDSAYIGKWTYEFLTLGQPISNELNTKILIEYLKGIGDVEGWALINYPNTYEQMAMLEKALTGREVPFDHKVINFADANIEDINPPSSRIVFEEDEIDTFAICRQSRLLPNPIVKAKDHPGPSTTFITKYIKVMPKPKILDDQDQSCIPLSNDATSIDEYYANQSIAYGFFYSILDPPTLKELAETITSQFSDKKLSFERTYRDEQKTLINSKAAIVKRLIPKSEWESSKRGEKKDVELEEENLQPEVQTQPINGHVRPGEDGWQWIDFPQSPVLLETLATLWKNIEEAYIENVKEMLSLKRMHTSAIVSYKNLILSILLEFINRPDNRQVLLQDFQRAFNEVDEDLREDVDMKCELHCRVDDFRTELWELCDVRRREAEDERRRTLRNQYILMEAVILVNVYIGILQTEIDRFVDTVQLLEDYYTSMSQKPLQELRFSKIVLNYVDFDGILWETLSVKDEEERTASEAKADSVKASVRIVNMNHFKAEIEHLLIDVSKDFDPDQNAVYNVIKDNIRQVRDQVDSISSMALEKLKKKEKPAVPKAKGKDTGNVSPNSTKLTRSHDLVDEWRYAVLFEIDRIHQRLNVLNAAAQSDVTFLLNFMRQTFHRIYHNIVERYKREIESINEMANIFCFAIEEEKRIQQELLFDDDQFVVRSSVLMFAKDPKGFVAPIKEVPSPLRFRIVQLGRLIDIFQRIAPSGILSKRALVYVLQDLVSCGEEDCYPPYVPCAWRQLRPPDIDKLIQRLFGPAEYIEWREFILYAMDLPIPSHQDILKMRTAFRKQDPELKEVITSDRFHSMLLWFLEISAHKDSLNEELDYGNCDKIADIMLREETRLGQIVSNFKNDFIETDENNISAMLRLMLAKELLRRMYLVNQNTVHYTAMLLSFCKDEDPREGLGKAFSLAMGGRVCTDTVKGERYAKELFEKRRASKLKLSPDYPREEAEEVAHEMISYIMNKTIKAIVMLEKEARDMTSKRRVVIQQLDEYHEINSTELLPPEVIREDLVIEDSSVINDEREYHSGSSLKLVSILSKNDEKIQPNKTVFWLPRDVCLTVLSTCLPWLASQANLFETSMSLCEGIAHVYNDLKDEELNDKEDLVLAHRLINHSFIRELLCASNNSPKAGLQLQRTDILDSLLKGFSLQGW